MEIGESAGLRKRDEGALPSLLQIIDEVSVFDSIEQNDKISISMPPTPSGQHSLNPKRVFFNEHAQPIPNASPSDTINTSSQTKFYSQPMPKGTVPYVKVANGTNPRAQLKPQARDPQVVGLRDSRFDSFKTWSGKLERQLSQIRGKPVPPIPENRPNAEPEILPVDRYFAALEGPELDTLRVSRQITRHFKIPRVKPLIECLMIL